MPGPHCPAPSARPFPTLPHHPRPAAQLGLELTLASRALNYSSPQDALDDLAGLWNGLSNLAALPTTTLAAFQAKQGGGGGEGAQQAAAAGKGEARV